MRPWRLTRDQARACDLAALAFREYATRAHYASKRTPTPGAVARFQAATLAYRKALAGVRAARPRPHYGRGRKPDLPLY